MEIGYTTILSIVSLLFSVVAISISIITSIKSKKRFTKLSEIIRDKAKGKDIKSSPMIASSTSRPSQNQAIAIKEEVKNQLLSDPSLINDLAMQVSKSQIAEVEKTRRVEKSKHLVEDSKPAETYNTISSKKTIYLEMPNKEGVWKPKRVSDSKSPNTLFTIEYNASSKPQEELEISIAANATVRNCIIDRPDDYKGEALIIKKVARGKGKSIKQISQGLVRKDANRDWKVVRPVQIEIH